MKSLLLVVLLVLVCCYATNADPLEFLYPLNKARRVLPRLTFTFKLAPSTFQPFNLDYWQGIGVLSLLGIFVTIAIVLFMFIFPKVRRCGLCGGMEPSTGFCFIGTPKTKPYPIWFRVITLFVVAFVLFLILIFVSIGFVTNQLFHTNFEDARKTTIKTTNNIFNSTSNLRTTWLRLVNVTGQTSQSELEAITTQLNTLVNGQGQLKNVSCELASKVGDMNKTRYMTIIIFLMFAALAPIYMLFSGIFHCKSVSLWASNLSMTLTFVCCCLFILHFCAAVVMSDFCTTVDDYVENGNTNAFGTTGNFAIVDGAKGILDLVSTCRKNGTFIGELAKISNAFRDGVVSAVNSNMKEADALKREFYYYYTNVSLAKTDPVLNTFSPQNRNAILGLINSAEECVGLSVDFGTLTNCTIIGNGFQEIRSSACLGILASVDFMWMNYIVLAFLQFVMSILGIYGYKLYRKKKYVNPKPKNELDKGLEVEMYDGLEVEEAHVL